MKRLRYVQIETSRHGKTIYYFRRKAGDARLRLPDIGDPSFRASYDAALRGQPTPHVRDMPVTPIARRKQRVERCLRIGIKASAGRAKRRGLAHDLTLDWALSQVERQDFRCALTGIEFYAETDARSFQHPYAPSFDRIVPALGYTPANVRIVCFSVNMMLADWGSEVFERVANSYRHQRQKRRRLPRTISPGAGCHAVSQLDQGVTK